jgi:hypothetical protein
MSATIQTRSPRQTLTGIGVESTTNRSSATRVANPIDRAWIGHTSHYLGAGLFEVPSGPVPSRSPREAVFSRGDGAGVTLFMLAAFALFFFGAILVVVGLRMENLSR